MQLNRHRRQRFVLTALLGLLAWLFVASVHVHTTDTDAELEAIYLQIVRAESRALEESTMLA